LPNPKLTIISGNARKIEGFMVNLKPDALALVSTQDNIWDLI
jgi:hypothetical protein